MGAPLRPPRPSPHAGVARWVLVLNTQLRFLNGTSLDDVQFQAMVRDTQVPVERSHLKWNWELISDVVAVNALLSARAVEQHRLARAPANAAVALTVHRPTCTWRRGGSRRRRLPSFSSVS